MNKTKSIEYPYFYDGYYWPNQTAYVERRTREAENNAEILKQNKLHLSASHRSMPTSILI
jgi:hypothetical protein